MAVYKSTYCSPLLESIDPRVVPVAPQGDLNPGTGQNPCIWLKCKINSSNKNITGYSIRILDSENNVIYPRRKTVISPVEGLPQDLGDSINSGLNGTMLYIPFIQNYRYAQGHETFNTIYYSPRFKADHLINWATDPNDWEPINDGDSDSAKWISKDSWNGTLDGEQVLPGEIILFINSGNSSNRYDGLYVLYEEVIGTTTHGVLKPYVDFTGYELTFKDEHGVMELFDKAILITHGTRHNQIWRYALGGWNIVTSPQWRSWPEDAAPSYEDLFNLDLENSNYKWEITLYQGDCDITTEHSRPACSYEDIDKNWYDMMLTSGTILGSTNKRIQIANEDEEIPAGSTSSPIVLQNRFVQLYDENGQQVADRARVSSYDATYGHVYPEENVFALNWIENSQKVRFFKHSNNEESVLDGEKVRLATTISIPIYIGDSSYEQIMQQSEAAALARDGHCYERIQVDYSSLTGISYSSVTEQEVNARWGNTHELTGTVERSDRVDRWVNQPDLNRWQASWQALSLYVREYITTFYFADGFPSGITANDITITLVDPTSNIYFDNISVDNITSSSNNRLFVRYSIFSNSVTQPTITTVVANVSVSFSPEYKFYKQVTLNPQINDSLGLIEIDGVQTQANDRVLVKNQIEPKQNGVYRVSAGAWTRDASFSQWGNFIGTLLYVQEGRDNRRTNWQSTAGPFGTLFNINSTTSGDTNLYFIPEQPIPLYLNKVKYGVTVVGNLGDLTPVASTNTWTTSNVMVDGIPLALKYLVYNTDNNKIYVVDSVIDNSMATVSLYADDSDLPVGTYISVEAGAVYGSQIIKIILDNDLKKITATNDLSEALILKNTVNKTYISPFVGMQAGMALKLLNGKMVTFDTTPTRTDRWIDINGVNTTLWYITHDDLITPLESASVSDDSVPWKYELRSYFKTSDENPFSCYEAPYLKILINNLPYFTEAEPYMVTDPTDYTEYLVTDGVYTVVIPGAIKTDDRKIEFTGVYIQHQQMSWESYRWVLVDHNGEIIQDTGKRYDKNMDVTFYGLDNGAMYAAILYVEDDANNTLTLVIYFGIDYNAQKINNLDFRADLECSSHSILLLAEYVNFASITETSDTSISSIGSGFYSSDVNIEQYDSLYEIIGTEGKTINQTDYSGTRSVQWSRSTVLIQQKSYAAIQCGDSHFQLVKYNNQIYIFDDQTVGSITVYKLGTEPEIWDILKLAKFNHSIYRREYQKFRSTKTNECKEYVGNWEPVALATEEGYIRDFNITSGRSYQYVLYATENAQTGEVQELKANLDENDKSLPVLTNWYEWSIAELVPVETPIDAPIIKNAYRVDTDNVWLFKYSLQTGEQTQNFQKQDVQTLGQYNRFGYGQQNFISGNVSCFLGSEIIPYTKQGYIERRRQSIAEPLTTNEKVAMLRQWRKIAFSPNPKLLTDIKGQSWIVQIVSSSNNPQNFYENQPDTISFAWKEYKTTDNVTIVGSGENLPKPGECKSDWVPENELPFYKKCGE